MKRWTAPIAILGILAIGGCSGPEPIDTSSLVDSRLDEAFETLEGMDSELNITTKPDVDPNGDKAQHWFVKEVQPDEDILPGGDITLELASSFHRAARFCGVGEVEDDGATLIIDMAGKDIGSGDLTLAEEECLLENLGIPTSVHEKMLATRALDGRRDGDWDGIAAEWSYHPDDGLDVILTLDD